MSTLNQAMPTPQYNPYLEDPSASASGAGAYFPQQAAFTAPAQPVCFCQLVSILTNDNSYNTTFTPPTAPIRVIFCHISD